MFVSGQIPAETDGTLVEGTVAAKTHKMCQNARAVLEAAGSSLDNVVNVTVSLTFLNHYYEQPGRLRFIKGIFPEHE